MINFATARRQMVDGQIRTYDVTNQAVLAALLAVPRELFVSEALREVAYSDLDVPLDGSSGKRRQLRPMVLAKLLQAAAIKPDDRVLDVGCGTGYSTAVLSQLCAHVVGLESDGGLHEKARVAFKTPDISSLTGSKITLALGPLEAGWPAGAPYDVILVNGSVDIVPEALRRQLAEGGRMLFIRGGGSTGKAVLMQLVHGKASERVIFDASGPPLPGFAEPETFVF